MNLWKNRNFTPMLLSETKKSFNDENYIFEIKFDGIRTLIFANPNEITIQSRNGVLLNDKCPELLEIKNMVNTDVIFDGEIIVQLNSKQSFKKLMDRILTKNLSKINWFAENFPITFVCFDIIYEKKDLTHMPLIKRKEILEKYKNCDIFVKSKYICKEGIELFEQTKKFDLEGIVAKKKDSVYSINNRTKEWIKIKNVLSSDFFIFGYKISEKGSVASLILGEKRNSKWYYVSKVTIGKISPDFEKIKKSPKLKKSLLHDFNEEDYIFIKPIYKCEVNYLERTDNNHLRHSVFKILKKA